jgi:hypothetical protein
MLGWALPVFDRRPRRDGQQRRRAHNPAHRLKPQKCSLRWPRCRSRKLGRHRFLDRDLQIEQCRSACLSGRYLHCHRRRPQTKPDQRPATMELRQIGGIGAPLTCNRAFCDLKWARNAGYFHLKRIPLSEVFSGSYDHRSSPTPSGARDRRLSLCSSVSPPQW